jgi:hypothetical protein
MPAASSVIAGFTSAAKPCGPIRARAACKDASVSLDSALDNHSRPILLTPASAPGALRNVLLKVLYDLAEGVPRNRGGSAGNPANFSALYWIFAAQRSVCCTDSRAAS